MEILGSTRYVDLKEQKEHWFQLSVINQWDWKTKPICYSNQSGHIISYCLYECTPISEDRYRQKIVEHLTDDMRECLERREYILAKK